METGNPKALAEAAVAVLKQKSAAIDAAMPNFLPSPDSAPTAEIRKHYEMVWDYNLRGGKRLRPALCMLSCEMFGGRQESALPTAVALEFLQNFLLIHDDIEDGSELRRGKPCLHVLHGIPLAINAGDSLFAKSFEALHANRKLLGASKTLRIMEEFIRQLNHTVEGQALEMGWLAENNWKITEKDYFRLVELKTAHYTITTPLKLGAIIAGASSKDVKALGKIGLQLGMAFQIQDDALNLVGDAAKYGKEIAGDLLEGKRTLVLVHLLKNCNPQQKTFVESALGKPRKEKDGQEIAKVVELIREKQSVEYAIGKANELAGEALEAFKKKFAHVQESPAKQDLLRVLQFAVTRSY